MKDFGKAAQEIGDALKRIPKNWDGRTAILEMKAAGFRHWKQMEWTGFYFQFLCERNLAGIVKVPGPRYGRVGFDGFRDIPWDFKAHAMNTSGHQVIVNDSIAVANGVRDYGAVGLLLAVGKVMYNDEDRTFQKWHEVLKGGKSKYEFDRIQRGAWSRIRKVSFDLQQISFIKITDKTLVKAGSFQQDFRNASGTPRKAKVLLDLEQIDKELKYFIEFR